MSENLVCPNCGSSRLATVERAEIWQPATFTLSEDGVVHRTDGLLVDIEWDAYDSEDVGDTETVGYACKDCIWTWGEEGNVNSECPFVTDAEFAASKASA